MMLPYAVVRSSDLPGGLEGGRLRWHVADPVAVLFEQREEPPTHTVDEVVAFGRALHQIWERMPLLPVRFGTHLEDTEELEEVVAEHLDDWLRRLDAVQGHSELIVHLPEAGRPVTADRAGNAQRSGAEYLHELVERAHARTATVAELRGELARFVRDDTWLPETDGPRLAILVPDSMVGEAMTAIEAWARRRGPDPVSVTGPWPPFSFCQEVTA